MKIVFLYRSVSEHGTQVEGYIRELRQRSSRVEVEEIDLDTREGADRARLYDVTTYPGILALRDDGQLAQLWQGEPLPLINEVISYAIQ